jgi:hypothetical protein
VKAIKSGARGYEKDEKHPTIFHELLEGNLSAIKKSVARLVQEAQTHHQRRHGDHPRGVCR